MITSTLVPADASPARELIAAMEAEITVEYDGLDLNDPRMPAGNAEVFRPPGGGYVVLFSDGAPVAGGGFKDLGADDACEIKRMYVIPPERGNGLGPALLAALEDAARAAGYRRVRLDCGEHQPRVADLYRRQGYRDVGNFNGNPLAVFFGEKDLA